MGASGVPVWCPPAQGSVALQRASLWENLDTPGLVFFLGLKPPLQRVPVQGCLSASCRNLFLREELHLEDPRSPK